MPNNIIINRLVFLLKNWNSIKIISSIVILTLLSSIMSPIFASPESPINTALSTHTQFLNETNPVMPDNNYQYDTYVIFITPNQNDYPTRSITSNFSDKLENISTTINSTKEYESTNYFEENNENCFSQYIYSVISTLASEISKKIFGKQLKTLVFNIDELKSAYPACETGSFIRKEITSSIRPGMYKEAVNLAKQDNHAAAGEKIQKGMIAIMLLYPFQLASGYLTGPTFEKLGMEHSIADNINTYSTSNSWFSGFHDFSERTAESLIALEHKTFSWAPSAISALILLITQKQFSQNTLEGLKKFNLLPAQSTTNDPKTALMILATNEAIASILTTAITVSAIALDPSYTKYKLFDFTKTVEDSKNFLQDIYNNPKETFDILNNTEINKMIGSGSSEFYNSLAQTISVGINIVLTAVAGGKNALVDKTKFDCITLYFRTPIAANALATKEQLIRSKGGNEENSWQIITNGMLINTALNIPYMILFIWPKIISQDPASQSMIRGWVAKATVGSFERNAKANLAAFDQKDQGWSKTISDWTPLVLAVTEYVITKNGIAKATPELRNKFVAISLLTSIFSLYSLYNLTL